MNLIEQIRADREKGTAGPWELSSGNGRVLSHWDGIGYWEIANASVTKFRGDSGTQYAAGGDQDTNARRIARVPDMEAALLAADRLAEALQKSMAGLTPHPQHLRNALDAYLAEVRK